MCFACWLQKAIDTLNTFNLLLFHINNSYTMVQLCHGCKHIACLFVNSSIQIVLLIYVNN